MSEEVFGWIATSLSLIYKLPQIYILYRKKKHEGLSIISLVVQALAYGFYIAHGIYIDDLPIMCMGIVSLLQSICLIVMYFVYKS
jgi:uncharacterized protein with PQ loop repeat